MRPAIHDHSLCGQNGRRYKLLRAHRHRCITTKYEIRFTAQSTSGRPMYGRSFFLHHAESRSAIADVNKAFSLSGGVNERYGDLSPTRAPFLLYGPTGNVLRSWHECLFPLPIWRNSLQTDLNETRYLLNSRKVRSKNLAGATGLDPAASCVTGKRSNQLNCTLAL